MLALDDLLRQDGYVEAIEKGGVTVKLSKIIKRVEQIEELSRQFPIDHEKCAMLEFELWGDVLHATAMGKGSEAKANAALDTLKLEFNRRWS